MPLARRRCSASSTWWPLAASWMLMAAELPALSAVMARLPNPIDQSCCLWRCRFSTGADHRITDPDVAFGLDGIEQGLDFLSQDLALHDGHQCRDDRPASAVGLHPLVLRGGRGILGVPEVIVGAARIGLMIMTPWTWAIAYRRYHQGVLIRFGHSKAVGAGTVMRLSATAGSADPVISGNGVWHRRGDLGCDCRRDE